MMPYKRSLPTKIKKWRKKWDLVSSEFADFILVFHELGERRVPVVPGPVVVVEVNDGQRGATRTRFRRRGFA